MALDILTSTLRLDLHAEIIDSSPPGEVIVRSYVFGESVPNTHVPAEGQMWKVTLEEGLLVGNVENVVSETTFMGDVCECVVSVSMKATLTPP